jgi:hypothetical protein
VFVCAYRCRVQWQGNDVFVCLFVCVCVCAEVMSDLTIAFQNGIK